MRAVFKLNDGRSILKQVVRGACLSIKIIIFMAAFLFLLSFLYSIYLEPEIILHILIVASITCLIVILIAFCVVAFCALSDWASS